MQNAESPQEVNKCRCSAHESRFSPGLSPYSGLFPPVSSGLPAAEECLNLKPITPRNCRAGRGVRLDYCYRISFLLSRSPLQPDMGEHSGHCVPARP